MNETNGIKYAAALLCRGSFPATLEETDEPCIVEASIYRLNAVAVTAFLLDGRDTYTTKHEIDDLVTVVHITREEATACQH